MLHNYTVHQPTTTIHSNNHQLPIVRPLRLLTTRPTQQNLPTKGHVVFSPIGDWRRPNSNDDCAVTHSFMQIVWCKHCTPTLPGWVPSLLTHSPLIRLQYPLFCWWLRELHIACLSVYRTPHSIIHRIICCFVDG